MYNEFFDSIRSYLYYRGATAELASDVAQEVFIRVWEKQIEYNPSKNKGLLYKIASDMFVSQIRKQNVANNYQNQIELKINEQTPETQMEYVQLKEKYELGLNALSDKQRSVFLMSRMEDLSYKEIAERLDISVKAVEKRMSTALAQLRTVLMAS